MNWKDFWNDRAADFTNPLAKVGRGEGEAFAEEQQKFDVTLAHLDELLDLQSTDKVLDICCGNALVAERLASKCSRWVGIDFTEELVKDANDHKFPNCEFFEGDALNLTSVVSEKFNKVLLHFSLQYFGKKAMVRTLLEEIYAVCESGSLIVISDIPDRRMRSQFYQTRRQKIRYHMQRLSGKEDMGYFFKQELLLALAQECGFKGELLEQDSSLPYSHYRFDMILKKR